MTRAGGLIFALFVLLTPVTLAQDRLKLVYGVTTPPSENNSKRASYTTMPQIMVELFQNSEFEMVPRTVPTGLRLQAEVGRGNVDVFLSFVNPTVKDMYPEAKYYVYPTKLGSMPVFFYQRNADRWSEANREDLAQQKLGFTRMPKSAAEKMTGLTLPASMHFGNHTSLLKGLLIKRVDIIIGSPRAINSAVDLLGAHGKVERLQIAFEVDLYMIFRSTLPGETKTQIIEHLDTAIPRFVSDNRFVHYFPSP